MGCGCKSKPNNSGSKKGDLESEFTSSIIFRIIIFAIAVVLLPLIFPIAIIMMFNQIILQRDTNVSGFVNSIAKRMTKKDKDEDEDYEEDEDEEVNPEEYELMDVEVIK